MEQEPIDTSIHQDLPYTQPATPQGKWLLMAACRHSYPWLHSNLVSESAQLGGFGTSKLEQNPPQKCWVWAVLLHLVCSHCGCLQCHRASSDGQTSCRYAAIWDEVGRKGYQGDWFVGDLSAVQSSGRHFTNLRHLSFKRTSGGVCLCCPPQCPGQMFTQK